MIMGYYETVQPFKYLYLANFHLYHYIVCDYLKIKLSNGFDVGGLLSIRLTNDPIHNI